MIDIRIQSDPLMDAFTQSVMEEIADEYKEALSNVRCPNHGEYPTILLSDRNSEEIEISVSGCCDALTALVDQLLEDEAG